MARRRREISFPLCFVLSLCFVFVFSGGLFTTINLCKEYERKLTAFDGGVSVLLKRWPPLDVIAAESLLSPRSAGEDCLRRNLLLRFTNKLRSRSIFKARFPLLLADEDLRLALLYMVLGELSNVWLILCTAVENPATSTCSNHQSSLQSLRHPPTFSPQPRNGSSVSTECYMKETEEEVGCRRTFSCSTLCSQALFQSRPKRYFVKPPVLHFSNPRLTSLFFSELPDLADLAAPEAFPHRNSSMARALPSPAHKFNQPWHSFEPSFCLWWLETLGPSVPALSPVKTMTAQGKTLIELVVSLNGPLKQIPSPFPCLMSSTSINNGPSVTPWPSNNASGTLDLLLPISDGPTLGFPLLSGLGFIPTNSSYLERLLSDLGFIPTNSSYLERLLSDLGFIPTNSFYLERLLSGLGFIPTNSSYLERLLSDLGFIPTNSSYLERLLSSLGFIPTNSSYLERLFLPTSSSAIERVGSSTSSYLVNILKCLASTFQISIYISGFLSSKVEFLQFIFWDSNGIRPARFCSRPTCDHPFQGPNATALQAHVRTFLETTENLSILVWLCIQRWFGLPQGSTIHRIKSPSSGATFTIWKTSCFLLLSFILVVIASAILSFSPM